MRDGNADGRTIGHRFHDAGKLRFGNELADLIRRIAHCAPLRRDDIFRHQTLGKILIHCDGAREIARAGIGNAEQVKRRLHAAVLAAGAVQGKKYNVRLGAYIEHTRAEHAAALILAARTHGGKIRLLLSDGIVAAEAVWRIKNVVKLALIILKAQEHIH